MSRPIIPLFLFLALALAGCGSQQAPVYETVATPAVAADTALPAPTEEVVLTVSGQIQNPNVDQTLQFDFATLDTLGVVRYEVDDPFVETKVTYSGILMSDFLRMVGAPPTATTVHFVALDDYEADIPIADLQKYPILLATRANGERMTIEKGGPTRIIYPYNSFPELKTDATNNLWVWSVKTMEIR